MRARGVQRGLADGQWYPNTLPSLPETPSATWDRAASRFGGKMPEMGTVPDMLMPCWLEGPMCRAGAAHGPLALCKEGIQPKDDLGVKSALFLVALWLASHCICHCTVAERLQTVLGTRCLPKA